MKSLLTALNQSWRQPLLCYYCTLYILLLLNSLSTEIVYLYLSSISHQNDKGKGPYPIHFYIFSIWQNVSKACILYEVDDNFKGATFSSWEGSEKNLSYYNGL